MKKFLLGAMMMLTVSTAQAADIQLTPPDTTGGMPLLDAISARRSGRDYADKMLSDKHLSTLLWTAWEFLPKTDVVLFRRHEIYRTWIYM